MVTLALQVSCKAVLVVRTSFRLGGWLMSSHVCRVIVTVQVSCAMLVDAQKRWLAVLAEDDPCTFGCCPVKHQYVCRESEEVVWAVG